MYRTLLKPLLFRLDPEKAHYTALSLFKTALAMPGYGWMHNKLFIPDDKRFGKNICGLQFKNPIGLAAGFDKNGEYIPLLAHLGFGFVEVGTVTPKQQPGNEKPRLFRLPTDFALINRMGFNNAGVDVMKKNLLARKTVDAREHYKLIIGGNIGKNKLTANEDAWKDYLHCFATLYEVVDYFVVNVSSPNTPGLRALQEKEPLKKILGQLQEENAGKKNKPVFLKIAPDISETQLNDIIEIVIACKLAGMIISNTTTDRTGLKTDAAKVDAIGAGGLSGKPLLQKSNDVLWYVRRQAGKEITLIGAGGIFTGEDAREKFDRGASLVQVYTGLIYEGPALVKNILKNI